MNRVIQGDCREVMRYLIAEEVQVQCCVTSPPYWGLRNYGVAGQLGLEPTLTEFVANMVEVFSLVRELLADDGTLWLNLGDSYAGAAGGAQGKTGDRASRTFTAKSITKQGAGLKPKDLCGIPWRVAFALQEAGWYLRQDIVWHKPNPMPESVRDRCTKAHEYLFLLAKSERYYYDADAIKEQSTYAGPNGSQLSPYAQGFGRRSKAEEQARQDKHREPGELTRNKRSVWTIATQPFAEAHFATFPQALVEPCILAGSRPGDIVFDPFLGSGTTAQGAQRLGRWWIGIELNPDYLPMQDKRTAQAALTL